MKFILSNYLILVFILGLSLSSCEKEVSVSTNEKEPENHAKIFINSKPAGAKIYLDGKNTGYITPDTVKWLLAGEYKVTLKKEYFKDTNVVVLIDYNSVPSKFLDYTTNPNMLGTLSLNSEPSGAKVIINDSLTNIKTPFKVNNMLPGIYNIDFDLPGYWLGKQQVIIQSQRDSYLNYKLKDTSLWVNYNMNNTDIHSNDLTCLAIDKNGIKWAGSWGYGIVRYDEKTWQYLDAANSPLLGNYVNCLVVDNLNRLWIGTDGGMAVKDGENWITYTMANSPLPANDVRGIAFTSDNKIWIATWGGGAALNDNGNWTVYSPSNSTFPHPYCSAVAVHPSTDEPWFALFGMGVVRYYSVDGTWKNWNKRNTAGVVATSAPPGSIRSGILNDNIQSIGIHPDGDIWAGVAAKIYDKGGLCYFNISAYKWVSYVATPSNQVFSITFSPDGVVWLGNGGAGLTRFDGTTFKTFNATNSRLENNYVNGIAIDKNGIKWLATYGGLVKYKGN
ncbi:MAG: hypothetical protein CO127_05935 [Ignavibacteria bacterium CG_4_9_14_3_um_filter_36_18]|nr:MAG: hypothetical protein CO127_05935 [Ignavibacteria bacterium CG_4_9_14_3_um_filter_36_18]